MILTKEQVRKKYKPLFSRLVTPLVELSDNACELYINLCEGNSEEKYQKAVMEFASALLFLYRHFAKRYEIKRGTIKTFLYDALTDEQLREIETILLKSDAWVNLEDLDDPKIIAPDDEDDSPLLKKYLHLWLNFDLTDTNDVLRQDSKDNQGYQQLENDDEVNANLYSLAKEETKRVKKELPKLYTKPYLATKKIFQEVMIKRGLESYNSLQDDVVIEF